jgi:hypothetical protein
MNGWQVDELEGISSASWRTVSRFTIADYPLHLFS